MRSAAWTTAALIADPPTTVDDESWGDIKAQRAR